MLVSCSLPSTLGGQVITSLGTDAPNVVGLVYIAAFGLDEGALLQGPPAPALAHVDVDSQGCAWLPEDDFFGHFAADIDPVKAKVMYSVQQPPPLPMFDDVMDTPSIEMSAVPGARQAR